MALCDLCHGKVLLQTGSEGKECSGCNMVLENSANLICQRCSTFRNLCERCGKPPVMGIFGPYCQPEDSIEHKCGIISLVGKLFIVHAREIPFEDGSGSWVPKYYYCPCDMVHPVAYDQGYGQIQHLLTSRSKLIRKTE